jgi:hypothetical protein
VRSIGFVAFKDGHPHRPQHRKGDREETKPLVCYISQVTASRASKQDDIREVFVNEPREVFIKEPTDA